jgi:predicted GIY-YIG superfamily endonuclease
MIGMYILRCSDGSYYVGSTRNIDLRLQQHGTGLGSTYTRTRLPVELVYFMECETVPDAYALEKKVQGWSRRKREALIAGRFDLLRGLSGSRHVRERQAASDFDTRPPAATQSAVNATSTSPAG